jgi:hypothetical protein
LLSGGLAFLIAAATTIGATTGGIAFLMRNAPTQVTIALVLAGVAVILAGLTTIWPTSAAKGSAPPAARHWIWHWWPKALVLLLSTVLLAVSLGFVFDTQKRLLQQPSRPDIASEWVAAGSVWALAITVKADALARDDQLYSAVVGWGRASPGAAVNGPAAGEPFTLYAGSTGPTPDGHGEQSQHVIVPAEIEGYTIDSIQVAAVVLKRETLNQALDAAAVPAAKAGTAQPSVVSLNCDGTLQIANSATGARIREIDDSINAIPACLNLSTVPGTSATAAAN